MYVETEELAGLARLQYKPDDQLLKCNLLTENVSLHIYFQSLQTGVEDHVEHSFLIKQLNTSLGLIRQTPWFTLPLTRPLFLEYLF